MKNLIYLMSFFILFSCEIITSSKGFDEMNLIKPELAGEYHKLERENINIFLPEGFKILTDEEIKKFHTEIEDERIRFFYQQSYEKQLLAKGNFYNFYSNEYESEVEIHTLPYMPFDKNSAQQLLYYIRKGHEKYQKVTGIYHEKIKATYSGDRSMQIFKAIYSLYKFNNGKIETEKDDNYIIYKTVYLITSKNKTFMLNILTPFEEDFDPFIRKIKL